jgi:Zn-dependent protease with chaperone function
LEEKTYPADARSFGDTVFGFVLCSSQVVELAIDVYVGLFLIGTFISLLGFFAEPLESAISRRFEREADDFALQLIGTGEPMTSALKRLASDNLANLSPHPLYAWFYYSHPPLVERIARLKAEKVGSRQ